MWIRGWTKAVAWIGGVVCVAGWCTGCGTLSHGRGWGQDAIYPLDGTRILRAAKRAALDPVTWVPAVGASVFALADLDEHTADWAVQHHPVFGSQDAAEEASDHLRNAAVTEAFLTALLTPSGEEPREWMFAKVRGVGVEATAWLATHAATSLLKDATDRTRPNRRDDRSFPSGHASGAFSAVALANRNLNTIAMSSVLRTSIKAANLALATTTAWARVEAGEHFPSDGLAGAALGNFITVLIHDALIGTPEEGFGFFVAPARDGVTVSISFAFD